MSILGPSRSWPIAGTPVDLVIGHVRAVLPDRVIDDARIVVRDGRIAEVGAHPSGAAAELDGHGLLVMPGLVDLHSDVLARECHPRPGASVPAEFALVTAQGRLRAAGVTTAFHGLAFQARSAVGLPIDSPDATTLHPLLVAEGAQILHRLDVRCPDGMAALRSVLASTEDDGARLVSYEDHTPGQGQYADPATMQRWLERAESMTPERAADHVEWWRTSRADTDALRTETLSWLGSLASSGRIRLLGHDPATGDDVAELTAAGGTIAEFPTTLTAAREARRLGLGVVAGAPNVVRGGSHAGNVSAAELVDAGLVDALASDYLPTAGLAAAVVLARQTTLGLPAAVALVTAGPARLAGRPDVGALTAGSRAELIAVDDRGAWPRVVTTLGGDR